MEESEYRVIERLVRHGQKRSDGYGLTMAKIETKSLKVNLQTRSGRKQLEKLMEDGWTVATQSTRGAISFSPGQTDVVLTRVDQKQVRKEQAKFERESQQAAQRDAERAERKAERRAESEHDRQVRAEERRVKMTAMSEERKEQRDERRAERHEEIVETRSRIEAFSVPNLGSTKVSKPGQVISTIEVISAQRATGSCAILLRVLGRRRLPRPELLTLVEQELDALDDAKLMSIMNKLLTYCQTLEIPEPGGVPTLVPEIDSVESPGTPLEAEPEVEESSEADDDVASQLVTLVNLRDAGALTEVEFQAAKRRLLHLEP